MQNDGEILELLGFMCQIRLTSSSLHNSKMGSYACIMSMVLGLRIYETNTFLAQSNKVNAQHTFDFILRVGRSKLIFVASPFFMFF